MERALKCALLIRPLNIKPSTLAQVGSQFASRQDRTSTLPADRFLNAYPIKNAKEKSEQRNGRSTYRKVTLITRERRKNLEYQKPARDPARGRRGSSETGGRLYVDSVADEGLMTSSVGVQA
ncbi:hypothetical protein EVAR_6652_1 [Eumeta japonica]|uniref:Uncharacterized protein n=1 Tax=Eumeta variegata TaxID=151549 RepID=A0A4C1TLC1_EUMVA|nr:hypothetical protein EVAR_6652_1 [Eumeta japonica]